MKGLFLKDIINLKQQVKVYVFIIGIWLVVSLVNNNEAFFGGVMSIFAVLVPITAIAYDDKAKWDRYALTMPVSKTDMVLSKYLLAFSCSVAGALLSSIIGIIITKDVAGTFASSVTFISLGMIFASVVLPIIFKFGVEKGRMIMLGVVLIPTILAIYLSKLNIFVPSEAIVTKIIGLSFFVALIITAISILISKHIYDRKDF